MWFRILIQYTWKAEDFPIFPVKEINQSRRFLNLYDGQKWEKHKLSEQLLLCLWIRQINRDVSEKLEISKFWYNMESEF